MQQPSTEKTNWRSIRPREAETTADSAGILDAAIQSSTALRSFLAAAAADKNELLLIVNDPYRGTQTRAALTALATYMRTSGLNPSVSAMVATGTHVVDPGRRKQFETRTFADCGLTISSIAWHESTNTGEMVDIGGVHLNQAVAKARHILAIGSVEPHYFAGVTGAHKTLTIGCMAKADIEANHVHSLSPDSRILRTVGNPVFDGVAKVLKVLVAAGKQFSVINEVICNDVVTAAAAGDPLATLDELMPALRRCFVYDIEKPVDILHLRVPPPLSSNLYQAEKALKNNGAAVRKGGGILLEATCEEGLGPRRFIDLLRTAPTYALSREFVSRRGYRLGDHKAVKLRHLTDSNCQGVFVAIATDRLRPDDLSGTGLVVLEDVAAAMDWLMHIVEPGPREGLVIEDAGNLCPRVLT